MKKYIAISICFLWVVQGKGQSPEFVDEISPYEFAALAVEAYKNPDMADSDNKGYHLAMDLGWIYVDSYEGPCGGLATSDYFGVAFKNSNKLIVAHRGTNSPLDLIVPDGAIALEQVPEQFECAKQFINFLKINPAYSNFSFYYTGHSLGALLAELSAAYDFTSRTAVTIESPGSYEITNYALINNIISRPLGYLSNDAYINSLRITAFNAGGNFINTTNTHVGKIFRVYPDFSNLPIPVPLCSVDYINYSLNQHSKDPLLNQFDNSTGIPKVWSFETNCWFESAPLCTSNLLYIDYYLNPYYWYRKLNIYNPAPVIKQAYILANLSVLKFPNCAKEINGSGSSDLIWGATNGSDNIYSFNGNDTIFAFEGNNRIDGGAGSDLINYDWLLFSDYNDIGIKVNLKDGFATGDGVSDILINIENVIGSVFKDLITGDDDGNVIDAGKGDDVIEAGGGINLLKGGPGKDRFVFKLKFNSMGVTTIIDDDGEIYIGNNKFEGAVAQNCSPYHLTVGGVEYTLLLLPDRLEIYEDGSAEKIIIPNFAEGKFGIKFNFIEANITGRKNRTVCADQPIENTLEVVVKNCNDCTTSWPDNKHTITMPGVFPLSVTVTDANGCSTTASTTVTIETICCGDCDSTGTDSSGVTGDPRSFPCVTNATFICIPFIRASDPNEIIGPAGYGDDHWVSRDEPLPYTVLFENDPDLATAPAQRVLVRVPIDPHLNPTSLRLGNFGFGSFQFTIPPNRATWTQRLDVRDSLGVFVDLTAGLDYQNNEAFWIFQSIDPVTGLAATLPATAGFLPVNDSITHRGEGYVSFTLVPKITAVTEDTVSEQAAIFFDDNEAISTNIVTNIIDAFPPVSAVDTLPAMTDTNCIVLYFSGQDDPGGVGVATFNLYVSQDSGAFFLYQSEIDTTALTFCGISGSSYRFYTRATDHVGNTEPPKTAAESSVMLGDNRLAVSARVFLQGPYVPAANLMHDSLRVQNRIPLTEPYTGLTGFTHTGGGGEQTDAAVLAVSGPDAIVDWVFLELRDESNPAQVLATRAALVQRDGDVVDVDGTSPVRFAPALDPGFYSLAVRHRNHLGVQTGAAGYYPKGIAVATDFRTLPPADMYAHNGLNPAQRLIGGKYTLWAGNGRVDFQLKYNGSNNDRNAILLVVGLATPNAIVPGYLPADYNLDGVVKYNGAANDRNVLLGNVGIATPSAVVEEQVAR